MWSGATLRIAAAAGATLEDQWSWKLDSSTASTVVSPGSRTASMIGVPTLPTARGRSPAFSQDRGQHADGRRLAVGAGEGQPRRGALVAQPPGQLDLADDLDPGPRGLGQQRVVGTPARRGDDQLHLVAAARWPSRPPRFASSSGSGRSDCSTTTTRSPPQGQAARGGGARDAQPGDDDTAHVIGHPFHVEETEARPPRTAWRSARTGPRSWSRPSP